jgi:hypothetical protein
MNGTAITKISFHEHCAYNGPERYHVRVHLTHEKAKEIAKAIVAEDLKYPHRLVTFKLFGLDIFVADRDHESDWGSGWQALGIDNDSAMFHWSEGASYLDLSIDKGLTAADFWEHGDNAPLPSTFWVQAAQ